jgi:LysR family carnitine catabolism transcriptional activator
MEIRQIEYVVGVAEAGGFTKAAGALHVTQPSLSQGIARLEAELGVDLFERIGRGVQLTAAGQAFLEPGRQVLRDVASLRTSLSAAAGVESGTLDLVALPTLAVDPVAAIVGRFRAKYPGVAVRMEHPEGVAALLQRVRSGQSEVGLTELPVDASGLVTAPLLEQEFSVVVPAGSPLATRHRVRIADLADVPLIATPIGTSTRRLVDDAFAAAGSTPLIAVETDQREAIIPMVLAGAGATIVPRSFADTAVALGACAIAVSPALRRTIGFVWRAGAQSPAARAFVACGSGGLRTTDRR